MYCRKNPLWIEKHFLNLFPLLIMKLIRQRVLKGFGKIEETQLGLLCGCHWLVLLRSFDAVKLTENSKTKSHSNYSDEMQYSKEKNKRNQKANGKLWWENRNAFVVDQTLKIIFLLFSLYILFCTPPPLRQYVFAFTEIGFYVKHTKLY